MLTLDFHAYCDADWNDDPNDRKSTIGWCIFLGDSHGRARNKMLHLDHPHQLSITPWLWLLVKIFGWVSYLHIWVSSWKITRLYIVATKVLLILLATLFFLSEPLYWNKLSFYSLSSSTWKFRRRSRWDELFLINDRCQVEVQWHMQLRHPNIPLNLNIVPIWSDQFNQAQVIYFHCSTLWQHEKTQNSAPSLYLSKGWKGHRLLVSALVEN